ncbi:hypothetical protein OG206_22240 [Streptomyces sp. NBC_01341]|uniref:hypothetical protein n=1 Tax=Streptomyces sp. NBC_01341 TaxID=2903831 RepID=UPI002E13F3E1|nr:hypothetical protein OG206_22240 [Streptomyces sp. NBC_01341]
MSRTNEPPTAFGPVRQALNAAGYGLDVYSDRTLLRDYRARFIPRLPVNATAEEFDNAVTAAKICAMARSGGHLCPVLGWRMLAMNPDPLATREIRTAIRKGVENLKRYEDGPPIPKINAQSGKAIEALLPVSPKPVLEMVAHLARSRGLSQAQIDTFVKDVQESTGERPDKRSPSTGLRNAFRIMCAEIGEPLTELSQKALDDAFLSSNPPARRLRELIEEQGHKSGARPSGGMVSLIDMVSTANLTDTDRALRLLDESGNDAVRGAVLHVGQARRTGDFPQEDHHMQRCRAAADWDALMTCQILDPATYLWWRASHGEAGPLLSFATHFLAEVARGAREEGEC